MSDHADNLIIGASENGLKDSRNGVDSVRDKGWMATLPLCTTVVREALLCLPDVVYLRGVNRVPVKGNGIRWNGTDSDYTLLAEDI